MGDSLDFLPMASVGGGGKGILIILWVVLNEQ